MINLPEEGIHYAQNKILASPPHTQLTQIGGQGRRPTLTITSMKRTIPALAALTLGLGLGLAGCSDDNPEQALEACTDMAQQISAAADNADFYSRQGQLDYMNKTVEALYPYREDSGDDALDAYVATAIRAHAKATGVDTAGREDNATAYANSLEDVMVYCTKLATN